MSKKLKYEIIKYFESIILQGDNQVEVTEANAEIMKIIDKHNCIPVSEGRRIKLPCKIGDKVKAEVLRPYNGHKSVMRGTVSDIQIVFRVTDEFGRFVDFLSSDLGRSIFFTELEGAE